MFNYENTEGFTAQEIELLNQAATELISQGYDEKAASDKLNNNYFSGCTLEDLIK